MTIGNVKESDNMEIDPPEQLENSGKMIEKQSPSTSTDTVGEVMEILHDKLPPMPKKLAFMFHHNFYPKLRVDLEDAHLTQETRQKLLNLKQKYDDIISKHGSDIGRTHLEKMKIDTDPNLPPLQATLPLIHHKFITDEIENLLETGLIKRFMSPYAAPIIVVSRKVNQEHP